MNMILEIILLIIALLASSFLSKRVVEDQVKDEPEEPKVKFKPTIDIYVEQLGDIYYAWENNVKFLFQHEDPNEVAKMLIKKYPNHNLNIHEKPL